MSDFTYHTPGVFTYSTMPPSGKMCRASPLPTPTEDACGTVRKARDCETPTNKRHGKRSRAQVPLTPKDLSYRPKRGTREARVTSLAPPPLLSLPPVRTSVGEARDISPVTPPPTLPLIQQATIQPTSLSHSSSTSSSTRDNEIGELLYERVCLCLPEQQLHWAGKIVGMFLELPKAEQDRMFDDASFLRERITDALLICEPVGSNLSSSSTSTIDQPLLSGEQVPNYSQSSSSNQPPPVPEQTISADEVMNQLNIVINDHEVRQRKPVTTIPVIQRSHSVSPSLPSRPSSPSEQSTLTRITDENASESEPKEDHTWNPNVHDPMDLPFTPEFYEDWWAKTWRAIDHYSREVLPRQVQYILDNRIRVLFQLFLVFFIFVLALIHNKTHVSVFYCAAVVAIEVIIIILQSRGSYVFPDDMVDSLYLTRMWYTVNAAFTLLFMLFWEPMLLCIVNILLYLLLTHDWFLSFFLPLNLAAMRGWGFLTTPLYLFHIALIHEFIFTRRFGRRGIYKHPYSSIAALTPRESYMTEVLRNMRQHTKPSSVKTLLDLERDPFFVSDVHLSPTDMRYETHQYNYEGKGKKRKLVSVTSRDVRTTKVVKFSDVTVLHPHFYEALKPLSPFRAATHVVCEEIVKLAMSLAWDKFGSSPPADGLSSVTRSVHVKLHYFNLPQSDMLIYNSILHGYNRYLTILNSNHDAAQYLQFTNILLGLENASYGKMRQRWFLRNFWLPEDHPFRTRLSKYVVANLAVGLIPIYGYIWRHVPDALKDKKSTPDNGTNLTFSGNTTTALNNTGVVQHALEFLKTAYRSITAYSVLAYAEPIPATNNYDNMIAGINGRLFVGSKDGTHIGHPQPQALKQLEETVKLDLNRWIPLSDIPSLREWLSLVKNYSATKKKMIERLEDTGRYFDTFFVKWEAYTGFKAPRIISNSDKKFLTVEGPVIKAIEDQLEALPSTLTGIPVSQWADVVYTQLAPYEGVEEYKIYVSDISSFESAITTQIKDATENLVFDRILQNYPLLASKLRARQKIRHYYKSVGMKVIEYDYDGRASGDARTYAGNTIVNHYLIRNLYRSLDVPFYPYFVSGDDCIFVMPSIIDPTSIEEYYRRLGFSVKLNETRIATSGFCGFNFEEGSFRRVCADPISVILKYFMTQFPLSVKKYRNYLSDQALCLLHEYPGDPVLRPAVEWVVRNVPCFTGKHRTWWQEQIMKEGNQWGNILRKPPMSFEVYSELHPEHDLSFYRDLSEHFHDAVVALFSGTDNYHAAKLASLIASVDLGTPREIFNDFQHLDPYSYEYDVDMGYYYPELTFFHLRAEGLIATR